jgi:hypothetical protein
MSSTSVVCPNCGKEIELSQALTHSIEERLSRQLEESHRKRLLEVETRIREKTIGELTPALEELKSQLFEKEKKLKESAGAERKLRKEKEELLERASQLDLEVARKVEEEREKIALAVEARKEQEYKLKETARHQVLKDLQSQVEMLKRQEDLLRKQASETEERIRQRIAEVERSAAEKARGESQVELEATAKQLEEERGKVRELARREVALLKEKQELEARSEQLDLEVARKLDEERKGIAAAVATRKDEEYRLREAEKEHKINDLLKQIDELKRRAEQGSMQLQGEVQELELEKMLQGEFPHDSITEISKGVRGADCMQEVFTPGGQPCGTILWESKRAKNWSNAWVDKLREDQREAKAEVAVIVSQALPEGLRHIGHLGGIWVCDFPSAIGMAYILRAGLIQVALARASVVGKNEKMEMLYGFLSGVEFRNAVQGVIEAFTQMREDLESEKRATERMWAKREKQATKAIVNMARMYGGIQGIVGKTLPSIPTLELPGGE